MSASPDNKFIQVFDITAAAVTATNKVQIIQSEKHDATFPKIQSGDIVKFDLYLAVQTETVNKFRKIAAFLYQSSFGNNDTKGWVVKFKVVDAINNANLTPFVSDSQKFVPSYLIDYDDDTSSINFNIVTGKCQTTTSWFLSGQVLKISKPAVKSEFYNLKDTSATVQLFYFMDKMNWKSRNLRRVLLDASDFSSQSALLLSETIENSKVTVIKSEKKYFFIQFQSGMYLSKGDFGSDMQIGKKKHRFYWKSHGILKVIDDLDDEYFVVPSKNLRHSSDHDIEDDRSRIIGTTDPENVIGLWDFV